jgi:hypothetical protein
MTRLLMKKCLALSLLLFALCGVARAQGKYAARVLLIPLDDRPPCLQFPTLLGRVGATEAVSPPRELLGRFTAPGQPERIAEWLKTQDLRSFDAAVVSLDMLAYGGLVASRVHRVSEETARQRLAVVEWLHKKAPRLPLYGSSVIMRLAPTGDGANEAYREKLARWAEISADQANREETARLEREIPAAALADYKQARVRNLSINLAALDMTRRGVLRYAVFSQDDAHPRGVHVADRERIIAETARLKLSPKVAVQPGADEVSMLLLSRALTARFKYQPRIHAIYSSEAVRTKVFPYEDREINRTVSFHIAAAGGVETAEQADADILFFVYGSRQEAGAAQAFAAQVAQAVKTRRRVIVADVDPLGDVQGADPAFMSELRRLQVLPQLSGLGAWNTAGNAIGTALPHGIIHNLAVNRLPRHAKTYADGQFGFLMNRLLDDYVYHSLVRPDAIKWARSQNWGTLRLDETQTRAVENYCRERMLPHAGELLNEFSRAPFVVSRARGAAWRMDLAQYELHNFFFALPWGRTFEAEMVFDLKPKN